MDLNNINNGGGVAALKKTKKNTSPKPNNRAGSGWRNEVPSAQQKQIDQQDEQKMNQRRRNLRKQMNMAINYREKVKRYVQPIKGGALMSRAQKKKQKRRRPQTPHLRREISFPGLPMDDGRPPWKSLTTSIGNTTSRAMDQKNTTRRPQSAAVLPGNRAEALQVHQSSSSTTGTGTGNNKKDDPVQRLQQHIHLNSIHASPTDPRPEEEKEQEDDRPRTPRSAIAHKRKVASERHHLRLKQKSRALKESLPSYYSPVKEYHPEVKEYNPRRRTYDHEYMVMSETPGPGTYGEQQFGSGIRGGVISESKGKSSIEWVQYYARQIPAPGQYNPSDPNEVSGVSTRIPDFVGKTNLETIIYNAKQLPGPGQYHLKDPIRKGGVISKAKSKSDVDWAVYRASSIPGPQDYPAPPLPKQGGGRFSNAVVPTDVEVLMRRTEQTPGPSDYVLNAFGSMIKGGKLNQNQNDKSWLDKIAMVASETPGSSDYKPLRFHGPGGGRFSTAKPKDHVETLIYNKRSIPGPGAYGAPDLPKSGTGKFNESRALTDVELLMLRSAESPAPGDYNPRYPDGSQISQRFSTANPKSNLEQLIHEAKQLPGPGQYQLKDPVRKGGVISKAVSKSETDWLIYRASSIPGPKYDLPPMRVQGLFGKISEGRPKSDLEWTIYRAKQLPAPDTYKLLGDFEKTAALNENNNVYGSRKKKKRSVEMRHSASAPALGSPA